MFRTRLQLITISVLALGVRLSLAAFGLTEACGPKGTNVYAVHQHGITGRGVNIALLSGGNVHDSHIAFARPDGSAVKLYDLTGGGLSRSAHDTHIAGIILSGGSQEHPDQIGAAGGARIHSARISNKQITSAFMMDALDTLILKKNCRIVVTGLQIYVDSVTPDGNSFWTKMYDYYAETYDVLLINASGNSYPQITIFGDSYNGITTSGLVKDEHGIYRTIGSISNRGPTLDGRKKPEIAAPTEDLFVPTSTGDTLWTALDPNGLGLTSYAIPHIAGAAALLLEAAAKSPESNDDKTEVIKAVLVNSANAAVFDSIGIQPLSTDSISRWKPDSGYGRLDALEAWETLMGGSIVKDNRPSSKKKGWAYAVMQKNETHEYRLDAVKGQRLMVTVTWHRKLQQVLKRFQEEPVRFYLDLKILSPSGKAAAFETAGPNNLIKTDLVLSEDGEYKIVLKNPTSVPGRDYGMAFNLLGPMTGNALAPNFPVAP
ncbi:MAG: S8 family serine peptidase [Planctomycetales bacterium]|nr:S8 family serine peptidase [Planctomycetales bacterium]